MAHQHRRDWNTLTRRKAYLQRVLNDVEGHGFATLILVDNVVVPERLDRTLLVVRMVGNIG